MAGRKPPPAFDPAMATALSGHEPMPEEDMTDFDDGDPEPSATDSSVGPAQPAASRRGGRGGGRQSKPRSDPALPPTFRTSVYFHRPVHDALREIAYSERANISDLINEGLDLVLRKRGYPAIADLRGKR